MTTVSTENRQNMHPVVREIDSNEQSISLFTLANIVLGHRWWVLGAASMVAIGGSALALVFRPYAAEAMIEIPSASSNSLAGVAGLAAQFGVNLGSLAGGESVQFYSDLVQSRDILSRVVNDTFRVATSADARDSLVTTLLDLYKSRGDTPRERTIDAVNTLTKKMTVSEDAEGSVLTIDVQAPYPRLAEQIVRRIVTLLNEFNLHSRQTQASVERQFIEGRLAAERDSLTAAEAAMTTFLERNRTYASAPALAFRAAELQRRIDLHQSVYTTLAQSVEQARIEEVRNTPVFNVVERPEGTGQPSWKTTPIVLLMGILGILTGAMTGFLREYIVNARKQQLGDFLEFQRLWRATLADTVRMLGLARRWVLPRRLHDRRGPDSA
jgi:uncharacterized protein involved in exopolysaccharide biosynthesis